MHEVTISLDEEATKWARLYAENRGISVADAIAEALRRRSRSRFGLRYETAFRDWRTMREARAQSDGSPYPTRDELHERSNFR